MNKIKTAIAVTALSILTGCGSENVTDAYSKVDELNEKVTQEATVIENIEENKVAEATGTANETQATESETIKPLGPPKVVKVESGALVADEVAQYSNMTLEVLDVAKGVTTDIVYEVMDQEEGTEFIELLENSQMTRGDLAYGLGEYYEYVVIKCKITNLSKRERRVYMGVPIYFLENGSDMDILEQGGTIDMSTFNYLDSTDEFVGEHFTHPIIGIPGVSNESLHHVFQPGEELVTYLWGQMATAYHPNAKFFICDKFLDGNVDGKLNLVAGTHLIPLEFEEE